MASRLVCIAAALFAALPAIAQEPADPCQKLAADKDWPKAAACLAQRPPQPGKTCGANDTELRARVFEQDGRFEAAAASWQKAALFCADEAQHVRTRRSNALAQIETAIDHLLAGKRAPAATALQAARRDFELQQDALQAEVPPSLQFLQNLAATGKGAIVRRFGGDVPEKIVQIARAPDGGAWLLTRADFGPSGGKVRLRKLDAGMRERRSITAGQAGDDVPVAIDIDATGQPLAIGTTTAEGKTEAWLCKPSLFAGKTQFIALPEVVAPKLVAQLAPHVWVAGSDAAGHPALFQLDAAGKAVAHYPVAASQFVRAKAKLLAIDAAGKAVPLSPKGVGKAQKAPKLPLQALPSELLAPAGMWRASVEAVGDAGVAVLALIK